MSWMDDLPGAYRSFGLTVSEGAGWRGFGVGDFTAGQPEAELIHQFVWPASASGADAVSMLTHGYDTGSYFLNPPVANKFLNLHRPGEPDVYLIAGRVAQHAGMGVLAVFQRAAAGLPPLGDGQNAPYGDDWSMGSFHYLGTEMHHYDREPFAQYAQLVAMCAADCQVFGWNVNHILEHSNHSTRKYEDLVSVDGNQLRRDIATALNSGGGVIPTDPPLLDESWLTVGAEQRIIDAIGYGNDKVMEGKSGEAPNYNLRDVYTRLQWVEDHVNARIAVLEARLFNRAPGSQSIVDEVQWAARHSQEGARLGVVVDDDTGAWYAVGPGTFWHLPDFNFVNTGRAAGLLDEDEHHVTGPDAIKIVRDVAMSPPGDIYVKPATYTVMPGDTWTKICTAHGVTSDALKAVNPQVGNIDVIAVGDVLNLPK